MFFISSSHLEAKSVIRSSALSSPMCGKKLVVEVHTFARLVQNFHYMMKYSEHICLSVFFLSQIVVRYN